MYEQFTDRSRHCMSLANKEAIRCYHEYIGTEHILLGLIKEGAGIAARVLVGSYRIDLLDVRMAIEQIVQQGPMACILGKLPLTPRAKKVVEYSLEEAHKLKHNFVDTGHLLLGLIRENEGVAAQVLANLGVTYQGALNAICEITTGQQDSSLEPRRTAPEAAVPEPEDSQDPEIQVLTAIAGVMSRGNLSEDAVLRIARWFASRFAGTDLQ